MILGKREKRGEGYDERRRGERYDWLGRKGVMEFEEGEEWFVGELEIRDLVDCVVRGFVVVEEVGVRGEVGGVGVGGKVVG